MTVLQKADLKYNTQGKWVDRKGVDVTKFNGPFGSHAGEEPTKNDWDGTTGGEVLFTLKPGEEIHMELPTPADAKAVMHALKFTPNNANKGSVDITIGGKGDFGNLHAPNGYTWPGSRPQDLAFGTDNAGNPSVYDLPQGKSTWVNIRPHPDPKTGKQEEVAVLIWLKG